MPVSSLADPTPEAAVSLIESGMTNGAMITIAGDCTVDYDGRTTSYLPAGERLIVLKPDGTLLVHQQKQRKPVNWQPPGCVHTVSIDSGDLHIRSTRKDPEEVVDITFNSVAQVSILDLTDGRSLELTGTEEDLKQELLSNPDQLEEGFTPQAAERWSIAGPADIYGEDVNGTPVIVELKRRRTGPDAVSQLKRYVDEFVRETSMDPDAVRGILVASSVTDSARQLLEQEDLELIRLDPPDEAAVTSSTLDDFTE